MKKKIAILGSTGSIGKSTLEIIKKINKFEVKLLLTNKNFIEITKQIKIFKPYVVIIINKDVYSKVKKKYPNKKFVLLNNIENIQRYIKKIDITVSAIPGIAGLKPTILVGDSLLLRKSYLSSSSIISFFNKSNAWSDIIGLFFSW